jgi:pyruvate kinase
MSTVELTVTPPDKALEAGVLNALELELATLRGALLAHEQKLQAVIHDVHADQLPSARNLIHYMELRRHDIRDLQLRLAQTGLSSLGRSESHVLVTIDRVLGMLALARGGLLSKDGTAPVGFRHGERLLAANTARLLGPGRAHRATRIVVTMPEEAATDAKLVKELMSAGMDCARINCAHDAERTWGGMIENIERARKDLNAECRILMDLGGPKLRVSSVDGKAQAVRLRVDDRFAIVPEERTRNAALLPDDAMPRLGCRVLEVFRDVQPGATVWINEGKLGGLVETASRTMLVVRVTHAKEKGRKVRPEHGINFPDSALNLPAMTARDMRDLDFVQRHADAVALSFVQSESDVMMLQNALEALDARDMAIVLKIETRSGFDNLPRILLTAMRSSSCGVMIARGDLAVETGFERLAEVQEEILWVAEAAHAPTIWATQVLESLARKGNLSRAEVTDAAMSGRAEAVLLNKGPYVLEAVRMLDDILGRMRAHHAKKRALLRQLHVAESL